MMNPAPELDSLFKNLRLTGMRDSISVRNKEAIQSKLAYTDFLMILLQDEIARREQTKYEKRLRKSKLQGSKTLDGFDFSFNPKVNQRQIMDLATCKFIYERVCVLIAGPCGTGKSHIAQAIAHCAIRQNIETLFLTQTELFQKLLAARGVGSYEARFKGICKVPLLIIDDFGLKPLKNGQDEDLHDLVSERYEKCSTIITSNLDFDEWGDAFPNKLLGAATLDRLRHAAYRLVLDGESYRSINRLDKSSSFDNLGN